MSAPTNVWNVELESDPDEWGAGVRGMRLLDRPTGTRLVCAVWELDPGARSPKYHAHHATEEMLLVLRGELILRAPGGDRRLAEGEVVHFPVGAEGAHQVRNESAESVRYLMIASHNPFDAIEYVDEGRVIVYSNADSALQGEPLFISHEMRGDA